MSNDGIARIAERAQRLLVDLAWAQWSVLSPIISEATRPAQAMIDPEALVLLSLLGERHERRLGDIAAGWLSVGVRWISLQRARSIAMRLPPTSQQLLATFAGIATDAGDHRWKRYLAPNSTGHATVFREKDCGPVRLDAAPAIMLRLRAGFGAGTKADVMAVLLGVGHPMTLRELSDALDYGTRPLRTALDDMAAAGFVERIASSPASFRAQYPQWSGVLNRGPNTGEVSPSPWMPWADVAVLLAYLLEWAQQATDLAWSDYIASSRARDVILEHLTPAMVQQMSLGLPADGSKWSLETFEALFGTVDAFVRAHW